MTNENTLNESSNADSASPPIAEQQTLLFAEISARNQTADLPTPTQNPPLLPLSSLEPEVFERVAAEIVSRQDNLSAHFYGRSGQKQYGLDIVERQLDQRVNLYQVRRYETITRSDLRKSLVDYAGSPRPTDYIGENRKFHAQRFVLVTSARFDADTGLVDELDELNNKYRGDLEILVWGAETLSRKLRGSPALVYAVFGANWAKVFCGFEPDSQVMPPPNPFGLVAGPLTALGLTTMEADAVATEITDPTEAARLFGILAKDLEAGHFPSNAAWMKRKQASVLSRAGEHQKSAAINFQLDFERIWAGEVLTPGHIHELTKNLSQLDDLQAAKQVALASLASWYERGTSLAELVPALREIVRRGDPDAASLCCFAIEGALVDGFFDFRPRFSITSILDDSIEDLMIELCNLAAAVETSDVTIRARLQCALADASLTANSSSEEVASAYNSLVVDASAGHFLHARGLVASRAASAFAKGGDIPRAEQLWRQSILASSEDQFYGDARNAFLAHRLFEFESGTVGTVEIDIAASRLPNQRRLIAGSFDPAFSAFEAAHRDKIPEALGDARRYLLESRVSGHLREEFIAEELLGDVFSAGGRVYQAIQKYVQAGKSEKAAQLACGLPELVDVSHWMKSPLRRQRAAAIQVTGAQSSLVTDSDVKETVEVLLKSTEGLWQSFRVSPMTELDAVSAIAKFGIRIPNSVVDDIIELATPPTSQAADVVPEIANLIVQTYWAVKERREDIAVTIARMLQQPNPPFQLWDLVQQMPASARGPLQAAVRTLAESGNPLGVAALAKWGETTSEVQLAARRAGAALLREPVGVEKSFISVGTQESATVGLLLALMDAKTFATIDIAELAPELARLPGGVFFQSGPVTASDVPIADLPPGKSRATRKRTPEGEHEPIGDVSNSPDEPALIAAGPPDQLGIAVAQHFLLVSEDALSGALPRVHALSALRHLIPRVRLPKECEQRLFDVFRDPRYTIMDLASMGPASRFSRFQLNMGEDSLPGYALVTSTELFRNRIISSSQVTDADREYVSRAFAGATSLLQDTRDEIKRLGALCLVALATSSEEFRWIAVCLICHSDPQIRAWGAEYMPANSDLFDTLSRDLSVEVRIAVASRSKELPESVRRELLDDPHLTIRRLLNEEYQ